jgi:hypothetical protein
MTNNNMLHRTLGKIVLGDIAVRASLTDISIIASGGCKAGGTATVTVGRIMKRVFANGKGELSGTAVLKAGYTYEGGGGIETGGAAPVFHRLALDMTFKWNVMRAFNFDVTMLWNIGTQPQFWYRVVGIDNPAACITQCKCVRYVTNVPASSPSDLCQKLLARKWKWAIESVGKSSLPLMKSDDDLDTGDPCFEPVDICHNPLCGELCLGANTSIEIGFDMAVYMTKIFHYAPSGTIRTGGEAECSTSPYLVQLTYEPTGSIQVLDGETFPLTTSQVVPPVTGSKASGVGRLKLRRVGEQDYIDFNIEYSNMSSAVTLILLRGPAGYGSNAAAILTLSDSGGLTSPCSAIGVPVSAAVATMISQGQCYIAVYTETRPRGEIRGQVSLPYGATYISSGYKCEPEGEFALGGVARTKVKKTSWNYIGGMWPLSVASQPAAVANKPVYYGGVDWQDIDNVLPSEGRATAQDGKSAFADLSFGRDSNFLFVTGFDLKVPADSKILGIQVTLNRVATFVTKDRRVYLTVNGELVSDNLASKNSWPYIYTESVYGSQFNDWRNESRDMYGEWTVANINSPTFGVAIQVGPQGVARDSFARIDYVSMDVYYEKADGSDTVHMTGEGVFVAENQHYVADGELIMRNAAKVTGTADWSYDPQNAEIALSGTYYRRIRYRTQLSQTLGGEARVRASKQDVVAEGGVICGGAGGVDFFAPSGGFRLAGTYTGFDIRMYQIVDGELSIGGEAQAVAIGSARTVAEGGVQLGGECAAKSPHWKYKMGNYPPLFVAGDAETSYRSYGRILLAQFAGDMAIRNLMGSLSDPKKVDVFEPIVGTVSACNCTSLPYILMLKHNLDVNNKLTEFLVRSNKAIPSLVSLYYNKVNDCWQSNQHIIGFGEDGGLDRWDILFEIQCATTNSAVSSLILKIQVMQQNSVRQNKRVTRFITEFVPTGLCTNNRLIFAVNFDTVLSSSTVSPSGVVSESRLSDGIGLFKNSLWLNDPVLKLEVTQDVLPMSPTKYELNIPGPPVAIYRT